ncbi:MAG: VCBS repeat-containing protein [Bacteroidota bacterium]
MTRYTTFYLFMAALMVLLMSACQQTAEVPTTQFSLLPSEKTGIDFINQLEFQQDFNIYTYRNFFNGGGVGIGDVNNDGLMDIYFSANMLPNKLYLNKGNLKFEDITESAGVAGQRSWSTGVSMVDINADGWIDIYVCNSGDVAGDNKQNELFINQKDGSFREMAADYGLADQGFSTHAAFFDYDKDGDLDVYLLNNSFEPIGNFNLRKNERPNRHPEGGDKLFRNDEGKFVDVSEAAGIYGSVIGFGLGVTVGDINLDGWQDIYISNDFFERDYIYMNNGDGTFGESLEQQMRSISAASMGADMADINNDGYPDIFVTEMLPEPNHRLKTKTTFEDWDKYQYNLENGYYHQFTRNMLQVNNGDASFSEVGRLAGVEATDWSWAPLICDFDNDGLRDLFIANGIYGDLTDQDYINYISDEEFLKTMISRENGVDYKAMTDVIPSNKIPNYMYKNLGDFRFEKVTEPWGLATPSHSNGSVYADLDNDGDMDLVINNVNEQAWIYENKNEVFNPASHYLKVALTGTGKNQQAIGARVAIYFGGNALHYEHVPVRGFESSVDPRAHFGLGAAEKVDSIVVRWPNNMITRLGEVPVDQLLTIDMAAAQGAGQTATTTANATPLRFEDKTAVSGIDFVHEESKFIDFNVDRLLYHMLSAEGPALCSGDLNGDGRSDFFVGGASGQAGAIYYQQANGSYRKASPGTLRVFEADQTKEDVDCACFDADGDQDMDIYVASGSNEFSNNSNELIDRLYLNDGRGRFSKANQTLPSFRFENSACVTPADVDGDGDMDLFVGIRARAGLVGVPMDGYLLENDGKGKFKDVAKTKAPQLKKLGMITDATWADIDQDKDPDLLVVGEWLGIRVFQNDGGQLKDISTSVKLDSTNGWWNTIEAVDLDKDGDMDFVLGNHGNNSRFSASKSRPVSMYVNDFDQNGSAEPIICTYLEDDSYPLALKHDLIEQLPGLKKKYVRYDAYKEAKINDIFSPEQMQRALVSEAYTLETALLINNGSQGFELKALPVQAQLSPTYAIATTDFNADGHVDILLGGNFFYSKPEVGIYDASFGTVLLGDGKNNFRYVPNKDLGLKIKEQVRGFALVPRGEKTDIIVARNNAPMMVLTY